MSDLATTEDVTKFMEYFYDVLLANPVAAPIFEEIDMEAHIPRVVGFWDGIAFGHGNYRGAPLMKHIPLGLATEHFVVWYETFTACLDELFQGPVATMVKERAHSIAFIFSSRLGLEPPAI